MFFMKTKGLIFVGFNQTLLDGKTRKVLRSLGGAIIARGYSLAILEGILIALANAERIASLSVCRGRLHQCLFFALPVNDDPILAEQIREARGLDLPRYGLIYKGTSERLIPSSILDMFSRFETEYCNAIHSVRELIECLGCIPGL